MVNVHGPNRSWTFSVPRGQAEQIAGAFNRNERFSISTKVGDPWADEPTTYYFNPALLIAVEVNV